VRNSSNNDDIQRRVRRMANFGEACTACRFSRIKCERRIGSACWRCTRLGVLCAFSEKPLRAPPLLHVRVQSSESTAIPRIPPTSALPTPPVQTAPLREFTAKYPSRARPASAFTPLLLLPKVTHTLAHASARKPASLQTQLQELQAMHHAAVARGDASLAACLILLQAGARGWVHCVHFAF
jgi:hypothetical protein